MKVAIVGSRSFKDQKAVKAYVRSLEQKDTIVSGACGEGPDLWAEEEAKKCGLRLILNPLPCP